MSLTTRRRRAAALGSFMFLSRWLQAPLYLGLIVAQAAYVWDFLVQLWHLLRGIAGHGLGDTDIMLMVLGLVDVVMVANLLIMVIIGGYETFVSRIEIDGHPDEPEWLDHVNPNVLKVKLAAAIIGISSIHLLKSFIEAGRTPHHTLMWQTIIHMVFVLSAIGLAIIDKLSNPKRPYAETTEPERAADADA